MPVYLLDERIAFPPPELASAEGLLAVGGDLSPERLLLAYRMGIFPWYNVGEPICWWSTDPRLVLFPAELKVSRSMRPYFNQSRFRVTVDQDFSAVIEACAGDDRLGQTWITEEMKAAYCRLHALGYAHSVEVWAGEALVGGLYGIALGRVFFGESMFSRVSNASKFGFIALVRRLEQLGYVMIDCQQETAHLQSLGAGNISRGLFIDLLDEHIPASLQAESWHGHPDFNHLSRWI
jgi:leucyl/phenylalanyl-tRNA--protein transferase